ncbi:MAG TPA: diaminopimelate epimerase, partial [Armatimonadota bacterium]|nr:diaminopimelate epimerase [Armatimonadota bacterium]
MSQKRRFTKVQAAGNDFILFDCLQEPELPWSSLAPRLCDRHRGIGSDGLLIVLPSMGANFRMRMFNPDGTEDFCGNGLRCVARYLHATGLHRQSELIL